FSGRMTIDDNAVPDTFPSAVFITPGQHFMLSDADNCSGYAISFNKEFYCVEYHDSEVSCNGCCL
ncbi:MAG: AraC family transcriptional regulator, partial [Bacteroidetes bacterium]|nr:AraC family transcriptional regulator [Bacteroidota bacterium]